MIRKTLTTSCSLLALALPATAVEIRGYDAADHDRFTVFPAAPVKNPAQLYSSLDLTSIGWYAPSPDIQFTLISRQHVLFASHFIGIIPTTQKIRFLNDAGQIIERTTPGRVTIQDGGLDTDLTLVTLNTPIDASDGVEPLPFLDLANDAAYNNLILGVAGKNPTSEAGKFPAIARGKIKEILADPLELDIGGDEVIDYTTRALRFDYKILFGGDDDCHFATGDSGSPSFVETGGKAALVGIHSAIELFPNETSPSTVQNFDSFVPEYADEIDAHMAPLGYRMRPVNAPTTTLNGTSSVIEATPRQAKPLTLEFDIGNTGANLTGNLEVEFLFATDEEPDSITGPGWVTYGSGAKWTLRRATLDPASTDTLTASWSSAPIISSINPTLVWRSDTVAEQTTSPVITLDPSYAAWADGLSEPLEGDDPDKDQLVNLLEYALGGDPESGLLVFADGGPLQPVISESGGNVTLTHPERSDKLLRGLTYILEFSSDLSGWSSTPPAGFSNLTAAYGPVVPGFEKSVSSWPPSDSHRFIRLRIELNE